MDHSDLHGYLKQNRVWHRFIEKQETIHSRDAAEAAGIELQRVTKNLVSETDDGEYVVLIVPGDRRANLKAAAKALEVRRVSLVSFDKAEKISGYPPGGTPSIGHKAKMRTVVDKILMEYDTIYCGGGSRNMLVELKTSDIVKLSAPIIASISSS
jgi:Cys-tRNA(Pro)/Cys-tRNA(Cys) deacylase